MTKKGATNDLKQVIVMRNDLGMRKGKMIAQGAHASIAFLTRRIEDLENGVRIPESFQRYGSFYLHDYLGLTYEMKQWLHGTFAKVCCRVDSEEELLKIRDEAVAAGLEVHLVTDSGKTEFHGQPTNTCLAIGPDRSEKIDPITGHLKLL